MYSSSGEQKMPSKRDALSQCILAMCPSSKKYHHRPMLAARSVSLRYSAVASNLGCLWLASQQAALWFRSLTLWSLKLLVNIFEVWALGTLCLVSYEYCSEVPAIYNISQKYWSDAIVGHNWTLHFRAFKWKFLIMIQRSHSSKQKVTNKNLAVSGPSEVHFCTEWRKVYI